MSESYETTSSDYGVASQAVNTSRSLKVGESRPQEGLNTAATAKWRLDNDRYSTGVTLTDDPEAVDGFMQLSNVPTDRRGGYTAVNRVTATDRVGLWSNGRFNTAGATVGNGAVPTFSNLQGGWGRIGPSTYHTMHGKWKRDNLLY